MSIDYATDIDARMIFHLCLQYGGVAACGGWKKRKTTGETSA
jgi:hypothetical protein